MHQHKSTTALGLAAVGLLTVACLAPGGSPSPTPAASAAPTTPAMPTASPLPSPSATSSPSPSPSPTPTQVVPTPPTSDTWTVPVRLSRERFDGLALDVDRSGQVHAAAVVEREGIWYLTNAGGDWAADPATRAPAGGADFTSAIAVADDGTVQIVFVRWDAWHPCQFECPPDPSRLAGLFHVVRTAAGWSEPVQLPLEVRGDNWLGNVQVVLAADGAHMVVERVDEAGNSVWYGRPSDGGWEFELVSQGGWAPSLALTTEGHPLIAFTRSHDDGYGISVAQRADVSFTETFIPGTERGMRPRLALDSTGRAHIVYGDDFGRSHHVVEGDDGWSEPTPTGAHFTAMAVDGQGALHLLYDAEGDDDEERDGLWYATNRYGGIDRLLVDSEPRLLADAAGPPSALAIDAAGRPHLLYAVLFSEERDGLWYTIGPSYPVGD